MNRPLMHWRHTMLAVALAVVAASAVAVAVAVSALREPSRLFE